MKKIGVTYEVTRRVYEEFCVSDEDYEAIYKGCLPDGIAQNMENLIDNSEGIKEDDWTAVDCETGKMLQDWRE